ncbi:DUF5362 family protein [Mucilaginibacter glaciei]|uniref:DUF5362 domain-containing protein n=1 Tax=Mucilaginibacter glaciei TaxID=2772109 RepID=A0A926P053_9SPHI|nr:DUF5362 family protein [Mucilaginibacter glaciei]MBD1394879.1 hypothetical protein [Mucilaginibacter glaciei]
METPEHPFEHTKDQNILLSEEAQYYLQKAGQWANFLSIIGFIVTGFTVIGALFVGTVFTNAAKINPMMPYPAMMGSIMSGFYLSFAVFNFFFSLYLYQFGSKVKEGILYSNTGQMTVAFGKLKSFFKLWGIATIVIIILYILIFIGAIVFAASIGSAMHTGGGSAL